MTKNEWLTCDDLTSLLDYLEGRSSERKLRLFACAACRRISHLLANPESLRAIDLTELYVDGQASAEECLAGARVAEGYAVCADPAHCTCDSGSLAVVWASDLVIQSNFAKNAAEGALSVAEGSASTTFRDATEKSMHIPPLEFPMTAQNVAEYCRVIGAINKAVEAQEAAFRKQETAQQLALLRDIFGNPFRPVGLDPRWLTSDVVALARGIYEERAFDRLPILADALMDAGCDSADVLDHCRSDGPHVRGCWVVDLLLGKE